MSPSANNRGFAWEQLHTVTAFLWQACATGFVLPTASAPQAGARRRGRAVVLRYSRDRLFVFGRRGGVEAVRDMMRLPADGFMLRIAEVMAYLERLA